MSDARRRHALDHGQDRVVLESFLDELDEVFPVPPSGRRDPDGEIGAEQDVSVVEETLDLRSPFLLVRSGPVLFLLFVFGVAVYEVVLVQIGGADREHDLDGGSRGRREGGDEGDTMINAVLEADDVR